MEEYKLKNDEALLNDALNIKNYEIDAIRKSQRTIVLSENEKDYLVNDCNINSSNIFVWNLIREINHNFKKNEESKVEPKPKRKRKRILSKGIENSPKVSIPSKNKFKDKTN